MEKIRNVGHEISKIAHQIHRNVDITGEIQSIEKITGANGWIIGYLAHHSDKELFQKDLEENFSLTRSTISKVLKLMEEKGLIRRESVAYDARLKKIVLTEKAWEIDSIVSRGRKKLENKMIQGFTEEEINTLLSMLDRISANLIK